MNLQDYEKVCLDMACESSKGKSAVRGKALLVLK